MKYLKNKLLLAFLLGFFVSFNGVAVTSLGTGTGALLGSDLTDPENDIDDSTSAGANFNWISATASSEPYFGSEGAFDVFDNQVGSGSTKWCCTAPPQFVAVQFTNFYVLTNFTIAAGNDSTGRDPDIWFIEGSNDGNTWTPIFTYNNIGTSPFALRNEVLRYDTGTDFMAPVAYSHFRYRVESTVGGGHQINELEFFGILVPMSDLSITKTDGVTSAVPGESLTYTIVANNAGPSDDPTVSVTDTFPAGLTCTYTSISAGGSTGNTTSGSGNLSESLNMPSGSSVTYTVICDIASDATGTLANTATILGSLADPQTSNNSANDNDTALSPEADLSIAVTSPADIVTPGSITYNIDVTNSGPSDASNVIVTDLLNVGYFTVQTVGCQEDPNGYPGCNLGTITSGATSSYAITFTIGTIDGAIDNSASVTSDATDSNMANNASGSSVLGTPVVIPTLNQLGLLLTVLIILSFGSYSIPKRRK